MKTTKPKSKKKPALQQGAVSGLLKAFLKWYDLSPEENAGKTHSALIRGFNAFNCR